MPKQKEEKLGDPPEEVLAPLPLYFIHRKFKINEKTTEAWNTRERMMVKYSCKQGAKHC